MKTRNYDEASVVKSLNRKKSISIDTVIKRIEIVANSPEIGIRNWGKIDYLCHVLHYTIWRRKSINKKANTNDYEEISTKEAKRMKKLNMAAMTKQAMKRAKSK